MFFQEPPRTQYDLNFQILGIPVRVHPFFWLLAALLGLGASGDDSRGLLIWIAVCFGSILVHEMGHALTIRYFGWRPHIVLYSFGGLAIYNPSLSPVQRGRRRVRNSGGVQILISLAGPGAGFLLAFFVLGLLAASGYQSSFSFLGRTWVIREGSLLPSLAASQLVVFLLYVNIYWGILNLLPVYPLDGGQVSRELFLANSNDGIRQSLTLSFVTAASIAVFVLVRWGEFYLALMFGYLAYMNYTQLSGPFGGTFGGSGRYRPW